MKFSYALVLSIGTLLAFASPAWAQTPGESNVQGEPVTQDTPFAPAGQSSLMDLREEMRMFVQSISAFARSYRPNFVVLASGGLDLLVKRDPIEETKTFPARTYMRSLDGIIQEGMFFDIKRGDRPFGTPPVEDRQLPMLAKTKFAKDNGLKVFTMDFGTGKGAVDAAYKQAGERGYVSFVAHTPSTDTHRLPAYPPRPFNENASHILSLDMVQNYVVIRNSAPFGRQDKFAMEMHDTNYDMVAVEVFHGRRPLGRQAVETLKFKKMGARRLVLAYMDIGSAASYHYYWRPNWREGSPFWISAPQRDDPDRYNVEYWREEWKQIIAGDTNSYVYGLIAQGFDGVIIDGLEAYKFFEGTTEEEEENQ
jgi:cysteinyl-tRNA synthetase, unknown class